MKCMNKFIAIQLVLLIMLGTVHGVFADNRNDHDFFQMFNLDYSGLESVKQAVTENNYALAHNLLIEYYQNRTFPVWYNKPSRPNNNLNYNTSKADAILEHQFTFNSIEANPDDPPGSGNINWTYTPNGDPEWYWALNRHFILKDLAYAYFETGQEKYAQGFSDIFLDWYLDNPVPNSKDNTGTWRTIEAGLRLSESMIYYFNTFILSPTVPNSVKLNLLTTLFQHGEYLYQHSGTNNWLLFECRGLYGLATYFPEFTESEKWKEAVHQRLEAEYDRQFLADGWQYELTTNYHIESVRSIYAVEEIAQMNGTSLPLSTNLLKSYEVVANIILPGVKTLPLNDTTIMLGNDFLYQGAKVAERTDPNKVAGLLSAATGYYKGNPQGLDNSKSDDWAGLIHMRDYRGHGETYGMLEVGNSGVGGHGWSSRDKLQFTLAANGRELLIDPGVYSYTNEAIAKYMYTTPAHNTVTIDGLEQIRRNQDLSNSAQNYVFQTSDSLDFASGLYNECYDEILKVPVTHKRDVIYVKSGYFLINDTLTGSGTHTARQYWNLAPGPYTVNQMTGRVNTQFADGANVLIIPLDYSAGNLEAITGGTNPYKGWASVGANSATPCLNINYKKVFADVGAMQTLIVPYFGDLAPEVVLEQTGSVVKITQNGYTDTIIIGNQEKDGYNFNGEAAVVREVGSDMIALSKLPEESILTYNGIPINITPLPVKQPRKVMDKLAPKGMLQSEWSQVKLNENAQYSSENDGSVKLAADGSITFSTEQSLSSIAIRARANQETYLNVSENGTAKGRIKINPSNVYNNYTVTGLSGGEVTVTNETGHAYIDYFNLNGSGIKQINHHVLRNRVPAPYAGIKFGNVAHEDYTIRTDLKLNSSLSVSSDSYIGIIARDNYKLEYSTRDKNLRLLRDDTVLSTSTVHLAYGEWYTFEFSVTGTSLSGQVYLRGMNTDAIGNITATDSMYISGMSGLFGKHTDVSVDNITLKLSDNTVVISEDFERYTTGRRPPNLIDDIGGIWRTEPDELFEPHSDEVYANYLNEEFSQYLGGLPTRWAGSASNLSRAVIDQNVWMKLNNPSGISELYYNMSESANNRVSLEADFIFSTYVNAPLLIFRQGDGTESYNIKLGTDGKIVAVGEGNKVLAAYEPNKKYNIRLVVDFASKTYALYLNNSLVAEGEKLQGNVSNIKIVYFAKLWSVGALYMDNAKISQLSTQIAYKVRNNGQIIVDDSIEKSNGAVQLSIYRDNRLLKHWLLERSDSVFDLNEDSSFKVQVFNWLDMTPLQGKKEYIINLDGSVSGENQQL